ncbi:MAG: hypothetical protein ABL995_14075 [Bryobacteraceae bacterium]
MKAWKLAVISALVCAPLAAQWLRQPTPGIPRLPNGKADLNAQTPRTPDGHPDFSGLWTRVSPKYARNIAADLKAGDVAPWAETLVKERIENLGREYMNVLCVPLGPGYSAAGDSTGAEMMKIVQTPNLILILNPDLTYRQVFMDGRKLEESPNPNWMGYSVGRWDGDTLVVESAGYNDKTWLDHDGHPHSEQLRMTERYRRRNFGNIDLEIAVSDPGVYAKPFTIKVSAVFAPDTEMLEWVCGENAAKPIQHWVGKASDERKGAFQVSPDVMTSYVGTFVEQPKLWRTVARVVEVSIYEGELYGDMDGRGKTPLIGMSEKEFSGLYGLGVEFTQNGDAPVEQLFVKHVSGNYRFARKK